MRNFKKWNAVMLIVLLLLGLTAVSKEVQAVGKNASDVKVLSQIVKEQRAKGSIVPTDLNASCYEWNSKGRLTAIDWGLETDWQKVPKLKGKVSFSKLPELKRLVINNCPELTSIDISGNKKLTNLDCTDNKKLTKLDVSKNKELRGIACYDNNLTKLDVSKCKKIEVLFCNNNKLTKLNVTKNTKLEELQCNNNKLTKLNVTKNTKLGDLQCDKNKLTKLNLSKNTKLQHLSCKKNKIKELDVTSCDSNIRIECDKKVNVIQYDDETVTDLKKLIKKQQKAGAKVPENLSDKCYTWNKSGKLTGINWSGMNLSGKISFEDFSELTTIDVSNNNLTEIETRRNKKLTTLNCANNNITKLLVRYNSELTTLDCTNNSITALFLRFNTKLVNLNCDSTVNVIR